MSAQLYIGTCSWKYDSWAGLVYSRPGTGNYLEQYARKFNTVEIDQWFWSLHKPDRISLPRREDALRYAEAVSDDFRFTIKVPNSLTLTHAYRRNKSDPLIENEHFLSVDLFDRFLETINPILPQTSVLIFQFEYLNKQKMPSQYHFLDALKRFAESARSPAKIAIETRNPQYLNADLFKTMEDYNLAPVFLEGYFMPSIIQTYRKIKTHKLDQAVIRLHGPNREEIERITNKQWNKIVAPKDDALSEIIPMIPDMMEKDISVHLNVNNHYEGSAPLTIDKIKGLLTTRQNTEFPNTDILQPIPAES